MAADYDYQLKLLLTGDAAVGKTSLMLRFVDDTFSDKPASPAGYDFWDTNGQERFRTVTASYYRNAQGVLLCYDVTNLESFLSLKEWLQQVDRYAGAESVKLVLVGCKDDLGTPQVSEEMEQEFAKAHSMSAFRCSSKVGTNVKEVFNALGEAVLSGLMDFEKDKGHKKTKDPVFSLDGDDGGKKDKGKKAKKGKTKKDKSSKGGCLV
ncbi:GTP-binding protein yptV1 [Pelomyxa schiedti]|nr:GTP-binding protein yptV1 [Pelomyxa schiedti]